MGKSQAESIQLHRISNKRFQFNLFYCQGSFSIPIKIYRPNCHPNFPNGGELTPWLEKIEVFSQIVQYIQAWYEGFHQEMYRKAYLSRPRELFIKVIFLFPRFDRPKDKKLLKNFKTILMCCGGTGITPIYQLILAICNNPDDNTQMILLYANRTVNDILLRKELEEFSAKNPNKLKLHYTVDQHFCQIPDENWKHFNGFVSLEMFKSVFPQQVNETILGTLCGPKPMNKLVLSLYEQYGLKEEQVLKF